MSPSKTHVITEAEASRTTLPSTEIVPAAPKATAPNRRTRRSTPAKQAPASGTAMIIADDKVKAQQASVLADVLVNIGFATETTERQEILWVDEMARYRRMFPAHSSVLEILGQDAPDLAGRSEAYRQAWSKVMDLARERLAERFVTEFGMNEIGAAAAAKAKVESDRKNVSVRYRNKLEASIRAEIENPVERARFVLAHGFRFSTTVTGDAPCIPVKDSKLTKNDKGEYVLSVPGHVVNAAKGTITKAKTTTAANQEGQGKDGATVATALQATIDSLKDATAKGDQLALLLHAQSIVNGLTGRVAPLEGTDEATRARALVDIERSLVNLKDHWKVSNEAIAAARKLPNTLKVTPAPAKDGATK